MSMRVFSFGLFLCVLISLRSSGNALPIQANDKDSSLEYLRTFGYIKPDEPGKSIKKSVDKNALLKESLIKFQKFHRLKETGELDNQTLGLMSKPRCGLPDQNPNLASIKSKWKKTELNYKIHNGYRDLDVNDIIARAFSYWSAVTKLKFRPANSPADINLEFSAQKHADNYPFDGRGGVLAHAFFPEDGRVHFDNDEIYTDKSPDGTNLLSVAVHELGHCLGLDHNNVPGSIMNPYYQGYNPNLKLGDYDVTSIQSLYGSNDQTTTTTSSSRPTPSTTSTSRHYSTTTAATRRPTPTASPADIPIQMFCLTAKKMKSFFMNSGNMYALDEGKQLWRYDANSRQLINEQMRDFKRLANKKVVGIEESLNTLLVFDHGQFWEFHNIKLVSNSPKNFRIKKKAIESFLRNRNLKLNNWEAVKAFTEHPEIILNYLFPSTFVIECAIRKKNKIYLIKNELAYEFDKEQSQIISIVQLNKLLPDLGILTQVISCAHHNDYLYIFTNEKVYKFDERSDRLVSGFPKNVC